MRLLGRDNKRRGKLMDCRHAKQFPGLTHCRLVNRGFREPICDTCQSQWFDGQPPTADALPPILYAIAQGAQFRPSKYDAPTGRAKPRTATRRPPHCDHAGIRLRKGPTCGTSVYSCDIHGEATCAKCTACPDFVPVDQLTTG